MADEISPRHALPLLHAAQAQKEIFHNEALLRLDALVAPVAQSATSAVPPVSPVAGECWIVAASGASGAWAGQENNLACWTEGGWRFLVPTPQLAVWVADVAEQRIWSGGAWQIGPLQSDGLYLGGARVVTNRQAAIGNPAGGAVIDTEARAAIATILSTMRLHGLISV